MKTYIMRWNPGISSYKLDAYREDHEKWPEGFTYNWSIYEWEDAQEGDRYIMTRVGDGPNGIVWLGEFLSDPYVDEDWAGTSKRRHYVDISVDTHSDPDDPLISIEQLETMLPEIDWRKGHSGQLLTDEQAKKLDSFFIRM